MTKDELRSVLPGGKWHEVAMKWAADDAAVLQVRDPLFNHKWDSTDTAHFVGGCEYRIKPQVLRYRVALMSYGLAFASTNDSVTAIINNGNFERWLGDWQEVEA